MHRVSWKAFVLGAAVLGLFASGVGLAGRSLQGDLARVIDERGVEPDGLFYTETEEASEAHEYLRNRRLR